jgi:hypothetical protein
MKIEQQMSMISIDAHTITNLMLCTAAAAQRATVPIVSSVASMVDLFQR